MESKGSALPGQYVWIRDVPELTILSGNLVRVLRGPDDDGYILIIFNSLRLSIKLSNVMLETREITFIKSLPFVSEHIDGWGECYVPARPS